MIAARQLEVDAEVRMEEEAKLVDAEAQREAQRMVAEVQRIAQNLRRALKGPAQQKSEFVKTFRALLQKHMLEVDMYDGEAGPSLGQGGAGLIRNTDQRGPDYQVFRQIGRPESHAERTALLTVSSHAPAKVPTGGGGPSDESVAAPVETTNGDHVSAWLSSILGKDAKQEHR